MHKPQEEILETIWTTEEDGLDTLDAVRERCAIEIGEGDLLLLEKRGMIRREGDRVVLSDQGRAEARGVVRRHRLAVTLFGTILDMEAEKREEIACEVEHTLLPEVEESICTLLGHPTVTPDGHPIPPGHCCETNRTTASTVIVNLTALAPGERGRITYIKPKHHQRLHRLTAFGLTPGTVVEVHQRRPAFCVRYEGTEIALNQDVAEDIFVAREGNGNASA